MKFRHEIKQIINLSDMMLLRTRLCTVMKRDEHCGSDGTYTVKSLYFDNYSDTALKEKLDGISHREKFRIRYYGCDTSYINLEKKSKISGLCNKEKVRISKEECEMLLCGDKSFLFSATDGLKKELYAKMYYKLLRPKCVVCYTRESFVYPPGNVRVTLDYDICGSNEVSGFLKEDFYYPRISKDIILEVKWDEFLPDIIRDAVQLGSRRTSAFSKYAASRI